MTADDLLAPSRAELLRRVRAKIAADPVGLTDPSELENRSEIADPAELSDPADAPPTGSTSGRVGYIQHVNPELARLLGALDLDRTYVRGEGLELVDDRGRRCLDFAGAYGALPFGHNDPEIWDAILAARAAGEPSFVQPSVLDSAGALAARLVALAPGDLDRVTFVNSGAEAVEAALKIARSSTGRRGVLSTHQSFHGKTLGALSATGRPDYQVDFGAPAPDFAWVDFGDLIAARNVLAAAPTYFAAVIVEPIQGEGGVHVAPAGYLAGLRALCTEHGVLLILDEVQTGLGRTGTLYACDADGVVPDVLTVAKALGGGLVPIGAVLTRSSIVPETFALRHTSTFGGGGLVCQVGLASLNRIAQPALLRQVNQRSVQLQTGLSRLADLYPGVVTAVRGRGLLLGVELSDDLDLTGDQGLIGSLAERGNLAMVLCSYLLNVEGLRLAPTLFGNRVLRVEPPLTVSAGECDRLLDGLGRAIALVASGASDTLLGHLVTPAQPSSSAEATSERGTDRPHRSKPRRPHRTAPAGMIRFGFVVHPLDAQGLTDFDPSVSTLDLEQRTALLERFDRASSVINPVPFIVGSGTVASRTGTKVFGELIGVPYTADQLLALPAARAHAVVREAGQLAVERGAKLVGLGAYTSIVTANGVGVGDLGVPVTTGNAFTAAASVRAVKAAARAKGIDLATTTVAVVGAGGAIGRAIAVALAPHASLLLLVGRPGGVSRRLQQTKVVVEATIGGLSTKGIESSSTPCRVETSDDAAGAARRADVIITASSSPEALLAAVDLPPGAIVCDVAQPPNLAPDVFTGRGDLTVFAGGIVTVPPGSDFDLRYGLPSGVTYACMAETMLLALTRADGTEQDMTRLYSVGESLDQNALSRLGRLADRHGFSLADARLRPTQAPAVVT